ncbi:unnamed protein product, partial [Symbiodinium sp. CCMP2592]
MPEVDAKVREQIAAVQVLEWLPEWLSSGCARLAEVLAPEPAKNIDTKQHSLEEAAALHPAAQENMKLLLRPSNSQLCRRRRTLGRNEWPFLIHRRGGLFIFIVRHTGDRGGRTIGRQSRFNFAALLRADHARHLPGG